MRELTQRPINDNEAHLTAHSHTHAGSNSNTYTPNADRQLIDELNRTYISHTHTHAHMDVRAYELVWNEKWGVNAYAHIHTTMFDAVIRGKRDNECSIMLRPFNLV